MPLEEDASSSTERWDRKAAREGLVCEDCSAPISYEDRAVYFERDVCAHCAQVRDKEGIFDGAPGSD